MTDETTETTQETLNEARQAARLSREAPRTADLAEGSTKQWYVIHTYSGYENKVKANLEHRDVQADHDRDGDHEQGQADHGFPRRPGDLLELGPALVEVAAHAGQHGGFSLPALMVGMDSEGSGRPVVAGATGLEPATAGFGDQCSTN